MASDTELLSAAVELGAAFRERSDEIEDARRIPEDVSRSMAEAGFYRMGIPRAVGGLETSPRTSSEVFETLAMGDASCAWVAFIAMTSGTALAAIPQTAARELLRDPLALLTGVFAPTGRAERVQGGFRVSGQWKWGSGSQNARWILGGCTLADQGAPMLDGAGRPRFTMAILPADEVEFVDTWRVSGLCGTGSLDYRAEEVFVPEERVVGFVAEGRPPVTPLYAFPNFTLLALGIGAVCMGIARAAIDDLVQVATSKGRVGSKKTIAEHPLAQAQLARAEADLRSARRLFYGTLDEVWEVALSGEPVGTAQRADLRLATSHAVAKSVSVVSAMYDLGGGASVYKTSRLQRSFRDIHVAKSHIMVAPSTFETVGRVLFGLDVQAASL